MGNCLGGISNNSYNNVQFNTGMNKPTKSEKEFASNLKTKLDDWVNNAPPSERNAREFVASQLERTHPASDSLTLQGSADLTSLPDALSEFKELKSLELSNIGRVSELPETLGELTQLDSLKIKNAEALNKLPDVIGQLTNLESLTLEGTTALSEISPEIGQCEKLENIKLVGTNLESLPPELLSSPALSEVYLSYNTSLKSMPELPNTLENMTSLVVYNSTKLENIPENMSQMPNLETLALNGAKALTKIPDDVSNLEKLKIVEVPNTSIESLGGDNTGFQALEFLNVSRTPITELPDGVTNDKLAYMDISHCQNIKQLPEGMQGLDRLIALHSPNVELPKDIIAHGAKIEVSPSLQMNEFLESQKDQMEGGLPDIEKYELRHGKFQIGDSKVKVLSPNDLSCNPIKNPPKQFASPAM